MKLSSKTIEIFRNFASIYPSVLFYKGKVQKVVTPTKTIVAIAELEEDMPQDWGIFDLNTFCATVSSLEDVDIEFFDKYCILSSGNTTVEYRYCPESALSDYRETKFVLPSADIQFELKKDVFDSTVKLANILKLTHLIIEGDGEHIYVSAINPDLGDKGGSSNKIRNKIGDTDKTFEIYVKLERIKIISDDYDVVVSKQRILELNAKNNKIKYWVACEKSSKFED